MLATTSAQASNEIRPNPMAQELIRESCDLWEDPQGVPHVKGRTDRVAIACLGFLHGRERSWQMDFLRRVAQGRKAEILGKDAIRADFLMKVLGLGDRAKSLFDRLDPEAQNQLWAYSFGVNQGFGVGKNRSYEFKKLNTQLEPWMPWDTMTLLLLQSFDQTRKTFETDFIENSRLARFPGVDSSVFRSEGLPWEATVLQEGEYPKRGSSKEIPIAPADSSSMNHANSRVLWDEIPQESAAQGSNSWVLGRKRSLTPNAWLANDPHLNLKHPPFWMWVHVEGDRLNTIGASLPGVPLIASGTNTHVSWGLTNSYLDSADIFSVPENDLKGAPSFRPWIWFKFWGIEVPFFFRSFKRTAQGWPVLPIDAPPGRKYVLRWTGFDLQPSDVHGLFDVMSASSVEEADRSLAQVGIPSWNFVFADTQGSIGYRAIGKVLRRTEGPSAKIQEKPLDQLENWPVLASREMPQVINPKRGWLASANNRQWPADAEFHGGWAYAESFRAFRIQELLQASGGQNRESIQKIQCDVQAVDARFLLPKILPVLEAQASTFSEAEHQALASLKVWDFQASLGCLACAPYRGMMEKILEGFDGNISALFRALGGTPIAGTPALSTRIPEAFREAVADLKIPAGGKLPAWGVVHRAPFGHLSGLSQFDSPPIPTPGDEYSVNPGSAHVGGGRFSQHSGASQRLIVEMSNPPTVYAILAGSNSDVERPNLTREGSPWRKWEECFLEKKFFPVDWSQVPSTKLNLVSVRGTEVPSR